MSGNGVAVGHGVAVRDRVAVGDRVAFGDKVAFGDDMGPVCNDYIQRQSADEKRLPTGKTIVGGNLAASVCSFC